MTKLDKHIEIVRSASKEFGSMSQESCDSIQSVLRQYYQKVGVTMLSDMSDLQLLVEKRPDLVFLGVKFLPLNRRTYQRDFNKIWIANYLDEHGISYTGSGHSAHRLEQNKPLAKQCALDAGLKTSLFYVASRNQPQNRANMPLEFPLFIKPADRGGGLGVDSFSLAHNFDQLESKVLSIAANLQSDSLIEEFLPGREFSVAIMKDEQTQVFSVMPIELVAATNNQGVRVLSGEIKSSNSEVVLEVTDKDIKSQVCALAMNVFEALGARDYGRVDIRLDSLGIPHFLEANLMPSLIGGYGSFPKACLLNSKMDHETVIVKIAGLGLARNNPSVSGLVYANEV